MKITPLPSVEDSWNDTLCQNRLIHYFDIVKQDRELAYTSLIEGIEARMEILNELYAKYNLETDKHGIYELQQIIEKVVKPLYGKE